MSKSMFDIIKKQNGEAFAKGIRDFDARIFTIPELPNIVRYAGRDATPVLDILNAFLAEPIEQDASNIDPFDLLEKAGYDAFYADTLKKQNSIRKYFDKDEQICTFDDPDRFKRHYIIHAIKKNARQLKRKDFKGKERRQDEYGTSVISIQISKNSGHVRITNRYNHTVNDPDNTFDSNPDKIIPGLTKALKTYFDVRSNIRWLTLPPYYLFCNNQIIHFTHEKNNVYFSNGFYVDNGVVFELKKDYQFFVEHFLVDLKEKTITDLSGEKDKFAQVLMDEIQGKNLQKQKTKDGHALFLDGQEFLKINEQGLITELILQKATHLPNGTLKMASELKKFVAPNLKTMGNECLTDCYCLKEICLPSLVTMGKYCFRHGCPVQKLVFENLRGIGPNCFVGIQSKELYLPLLRSIGAISIRNCSSLEKIYAPKVERIACHAIGSNENLKTIFMPRCMYIETGVIMENESLTSLFLPRLKSIDENSIARNSALTHIYVPKLKEVAENSLSRNGLQAYIEAENLVRVKGEHPLKFVTHLYAPYFRFRPEQFDKFFEIILKNRQFIKKNESVFNFFGLLNYCRKRQRGM